MNRKATTALVVLALGTGTDREAWAWGATGHEWVSGIAIEKLPDSVPGFVRTPEAAAEIAVMGRELDRSKGAGETHDAERDPGHYVDLADDGSVMGVLPLASCRRRARNTTRSLRARAPRNTRRATCRIRSSTAGSRSCKDFAYWRAAVKGAETAATPEERAWFEADRRLREKLTLRDIGVWSHYVGDASQPLHVSVHFNGWGDFPNPAATRQEIHAYFEGEFVRRNVVRAEVAADVGPYRPAAARSRNARGRCCWPPSPRSRRSTRSRRTAASSPATARHRVCHGAACAGASAVRDMIVDAWLASADTPVGYPMVNVRDIESGKVRATRDLFGKD